VSTFGSYSKTYGTLAGVVVLPVWLWLTNVALLLGLELNSERERTIELADGVPGPTWRSSSSRAADPLRDAPPNAPPRR
jgi:uncharacterized BrkB/YihY/UPF0761 family membrane protein